MQIDTGTTSETTLEKAALKALRAARWFAGGWRNSSLEVEGLRVTRVAPSIERLDAGELFHDHDETTFDMLEKAIVKHLNNMGDGYGTYALNRDTCYDDLYFPDLEKGRVLIEQWKSFKSARQQVIDLRRARIISDQFS